ncbi:DNA adenine methylase [Cronobacter dublinensis]|uniref:DNA adenine methylase n=1 Tax=Cronobacter dublinensis TaxID=413497 RepID=UPI000CFCC239|nr:DNA adenine methylase [Cronobacter malonaticus]ELY4491562.1 DNA adenine methylase [Cronobacter malonaticus]ELY6297008.1 DNA adenine methylase [Cronobacter malonaticus]ELY6317828.1 DNA adenine methylase [Cronobacter malonaticus]
MSTILKWAGNKTAIMPELIKHLPEGSRLVEPFAGSCAVMMATEYPHYLVADINPDLINLYRQVQGNSESFIAVAKGFFDGANNESAYYKVREEFNYSREVNNFWRAIYFLYLNRNGYRGMCRYNKSGYFNVPYGNYKEPYFPEKEIRAFAEKAKRATFICAHYEETLSMLRPDDVIYCDPPYASDDGEIFTSYHTNGFNTDDQYRLASVLTYRAREGYPVIASNSDSMLARSLYREFQCVKVTAPRSLGVAAGSSKSAQEIIAVYDTTAASKEYPWIAFDRGTEFTQPLNDGV